MPPSHLLIFDIDGTLLNMDEETSFVDAFREQTGVTPHMNWEVYRSCTDWGVAIEILEGHLGRQPTEEEVRSALDLFVHHLGRNIASGQAPLNPTPGAIEFIQRAAGEGYALALATGCVRASADTKVRALGLEEHFVVGGYGDMRFDRETLVRDAIAAAEAQFGLSFGRERICYFGDRRWDAEAARALGIRFVGVAVTPEARERLQAAGAERIVADFTELAGPEACFAPRAAP
jgi:phosphoglycolate phosphatase